MPEAEDIHDTLAHPALSGQTMNRLKMAESFTLRKYGKYEIF
jgi:hypothetical protein